MQWAFLYIRLCQVERFIYNISSLELILTARSSVLFFYLADKLDEEVIQDGVRIFIDKKAQLSLLGKRTNKIKRLMSGLWTFFLKQFLIIAGTEMDFVETKLAAEFVFNNPNIKGTCGCGESFSL